MEFACPCLNVQLHVPASALRDRASTGSPPRLDSGKLLMELSGSSEETMTGLQGDAFFAASLATGSFHQSHRLLLQWPRHLGSWAEGRQFPSVVSLRGVESVEGGGEDWEVVRCLLCEADLWAKPTRAHDAHTLLINTDIPSGEEVRGMAEGGDYSPALGVRILHTHGGGGDSLGAGEEWWSGNSGAAAQVQASVSEYLRAEQEAMETRVRSYVEAEHNRFELLRKEAKRHRDTVLRDLQARNLIKEPADALALAAARVRNGSGNDSAVPLSPVSLASLSDPGPISQPLGIRNSNRAKPGLTSSPVIGSEDSGIGPDHKEDEELFRLDEEHPITNLPVPTLVEHPPQSSAPPCLADDEAETDDSGQGDDPRRFEGRGSTAGLLGARPIAAQGAGCLVSACGKSLPVRVPCRFWPPKDAIGSEQASSSEDEDEYNTGDRIAVKPRRGADYSGKDAREGRRREADVAESMRKLARSIQAADDPERIFGERPARRRYKTGTAQAMEAVVRMRHSGRPQQHSFLNL